MAADLKLIYTAPNEHAAYGALSAFAQKWDNTYPTISTTWQQNWQEIIPFLAFPDYIRKVVYTTNAIESVNRQIRKTLKSKGAFPNDEAVLKLVFLALQMHRKNGLCLSGNGSSL